MRKTLLIAVAATFALSGCGNKEAEVHHAETEGIYVTLGDLKYQVQISRALNPRAIPEDASFVKGIDPAEAQLDSDEVWFAVFVRVENDNIEGEELPLAEHFEIEDQQGNHYEPVELDETNEFRWDPTPLKPKSVAPNPDGIAGQLHSIGGMLQLFKVEHKTLDNRPLELIIEDEEGHEATVELDV